MPYLGYALILAICTGVIFLSLTKERPRVYLIFLYFTGLSLLLTTTLAGPYITGCDIHLEYYYAQFYAGLDVLPPLIGTPQGASAGNTVLAPLIGNIVPLLWVYKLVYPIIYATVPVLLYFLFQKWFTAKQSFLAAFLFIAFTPFWMEVPTVARHLLTEILIVGILYIIYKSTLQRKYSVPLVTALGALAAISYYTVTIVSLAMLSVMLLAGLIFKRKRVLLTCTILGAIISGCIYYPIASEGAVAIKLGHFYNAYVPTRFELDIPKQRVPIPAIITSSVVKDENGDPLIVDDREDLPPEVERGEGLEPSTVPGTTNRVALPGASTKIVELEPPKHDIFASSSVPYYKRLGSFIRSAIGLGWSERDGWSRAYIVLQWLFIALVPIGLWKTRKNKKYLMVASGGLFLLFLLLIPGFTGLLSLTRTVHLALLVLAPTIAVSLKPKYLTPILVIYFLFASGFVFEVTQQPNIEKMTMPYNYGISNPRIDLGIGASITNDDYAIRQYIYDNNLFPTYSDIQGADFMGEIVGWRSTWNRTFKTSEGMDTTRVGYAFINSRTTQDRLFTLWSGPGCRTRVTPESLGVDIDKNIIYQIGDARVIRLEE